MSNDSTDQSPGLSGNLGLVGLAAIFAVKFTEKALLRLTALWQAHPKLCILLISILVANAVLLLVAILWNSSVRRKVEKDITAEDDTSVYLGRTEDGEDIHLKQRYRTTHTDIIGTTSVGKTESLILPMAIRDLETGAGLLIIDGKADLSFLEKFYAYAVKAGRANDFRLFSLAHTDTSSTFNPLVGGTSYEIAERVFSSFTFENEYFRNVQYKLFHAIIQLILARKEVPTFTLVKRLLTDSELLTSWLEHCEQEDIRHDLSNFLHEPDHKRIERVSGLEAHLSHFTSGHLAPLFNAVQPQITMDKVLRDNLVCYFQLPSMYYQELSKATGRLVLQCFQNAVSKRHLGLTEKPGFFSCFLDDFQDYIYEGFGALLNKARSANVGVVFSHQALGDLEKVSPAFKNIVLTNTNIKCVMRANDPDTAEYFAKSFGTTKAEKVTERQKKSLLGETRTGDGSVRDVEEFRYHPNEIRSLGVAEGIVTIPHVNGVKVVKLRFKKRDDIEPVPLPKVPKDAGSHPTKIISNTETDTETTRFHPEELITAPGSSNECATPAPQSV